MPPDGHTAAAASDCIRPNPPAPHGRGQAFGWILGAGGLLDRPIQPPAPTDPSLLTTIAHGLSAVRFIYFPLALTALLAVGVHAAADALDQRVLWVVDHLDAVFDAIVGRFELTASWVNWVGLDDRVRIARLVAFAWELAGDVVLAIPVLGFDVEEGASFVECARDVFRRPTLLRVSRPLVALVIAFVGANAVAAMVHGATFLIVRAVLGRAAGLAISGTLSLGVLVALLAAFAAPAAIGHLKRADRFARAPGARYLRETHRGLIGTAIVVPLALMAALQAASFLASFW